MAQHDDVDRQLQDPGQFDKSFAYMVDTLKDNVKDANRCNHILEAMVVSWLHVMYKFQSLPSATPREWLHYQLAQEMHNATITKNQQLQRYEWMNRVAILSMQL